MKPAPNVPGNTPAERMNNAVRIMLAVSKDDLLRKEARLKRAVVNYIVALDRIASREHWPARDK